MFQNFSGELLPPPPPEPPEQAAKRVVAATPPARPRKPRRVKAAPVDSDAIIRSFRPHRCRASMRIFVVECQVGAPVAATSSTAVLSSFFVLLDVSTFSMEPRTYLPET